MKGKEENIKRLRKCKSGIFLLRIPKDHPDDLWSGKLMRRDCKSLDGMDPWVSDVHQCLDIW
jgi:hypothetical protein